jgi:Flp pilus assembly protein TadG
MVATALSFVFLLGAVGLSIDIGRMYITHNEVQAYADSASLAAAVQLDGSPAGITRATNARAGDSDKWRFDTTPITNVTTTFGTSANGPFTSTPSDPKNYSYAKVVAVVNLPMSLLAPIVGRYAQVSASAVAGGTPITTVTDGFPFSPYTRVASPDDATDPFGYKVGNPYTLRWGAPGNKTSCGTDETSKNLSSNGQIRGYCCAGSASSIRAAIVGMNTDPVTLGNPVPMDNGAKDTEMTTIADRVTLDSDAKSATYSDYESSHTGNGMRVVVVAVNGGPPNYTAVGFAAFFLLTPDKYTKLNGNDSACAEYIGPWTGSVPAGAGAFHIRLVQ